jgi:hypothetical protein
MGRNSIKGSSNCYYPLIVDSKRKDCTVFYGGDFFMKNSKDEEEPEVFQELFSDIKEVSNHMIRFHENKFVMLAYMIV